MADIQSQQAVLKEDYSMDKKALQQTAKLKALGKTLMARGGKTFDSKVAWVKKNIPRLQTQKHL